MNEQITGLMFKQMVLHGSAAITAQKQAINDLNVFPVPDGDTGTNMSMTIGAAAAELRKSNPATVEQAASITASTLLRGARGNSGVFPKASRDTRRLMPPPSPLPCRKASAPPIRR